MCVCGYFGILRRQRLALHLHAALVVLCQQPLPLLSADHSIALQQGRKPLPLIPRRIHHIQKPI